MITSIYDPGRKDGKIVDTEDIRFANSPFGVVDCHSGIDDTGKVIRNIILRMMYAISDDVSLPERILRINKAVDHHYGNKEFETRAGAVFALAEIRDDSVRIIQGGDSFAVWQLRSGKIGFTPNQYEEFDIKAVINHAQLKKRYGSDEGKILSEQKKFLAEEIRKTHANKDYADINGDSRIQECWSETQIFLEDLSVLLFFTNGLITGLPEYGSSKILLEGILNMSKEEGLEDLVDWVRSRQKENLQNAHIKFPEISVVLVRF